jgi:threonine/homoserine/homoserine lactone efflux protein
MIAYILQGIVYGFAAAVQPGPFQAYAILQAVRYGWRKALVYALVPLCSDLPIIAVVIFVLALVPDAWVIVLRFIGGLFLLYLAGKALLGARRLSDEPEPGAGSHPRNFFQAVLINLLNPNPYLFWSLISGPILVAGWKQNPAYAVGMLAAFYLVMILCTGGLIILVSAVRGLHKNMRLAFVLLSACGLAFFGVYQIWMGAVALFPGLGNILGGGG